MKPIILLLYWLPAVMLLTCVVPQARFTAELMDDEDSFKKLLIASICPVINILVLIVFIYVQIYGWDAVKKLQDWYESLPDEDESDNEDDVDKQDGVK